MANSEKQILTTQQEAISSVESFLSEVRRVATNLRRVEKKGGELWNVEFDKFPDVKDPGK